MSQVLFFQKIRESLPPNRSLVDELNDILGVTNDGVYRRMRGETALTFSEIQKLCKKFGVSFDMFVETSKNSVLFEYTSSQHTENFLQNYFEDLKGKLTAIQRIEKKKITYAAEGIPIFYYFNSEELTRFKLFFWKRAILELPEFKGKIYDPSLISDQLVELARSLTRIYNTLPVTEIWSDETVLGNIKQIDFAYESGLFSSRQEALKICDELGRVLEMIRAMAEKRAKFTDEKKWAENENTLDLFRSDVNISTACILVSTGSGKICFYSPHTFNAMVTSNEAFCSDTERWLNSIISKSEGISGTGEKQRVRFFNASLVKLDKLKEKIRA
ncbi:MAG: helix-turn-helix domain-containing protein [Bacteroidota bacterium]